MRKAVRYVCFALLLVACVGGQVATRDFWSTLFSFSADYHPDALWVFGWIIVFSVIPLLAFGFSVAATATARWRKKIKTVALVLSISSAAFTALMLAGTRSTGGLIWMFLVLPFAVIHISASFGFAATLDEKTEG